jgi:NADH:ubiquinone oxidoreductase subunit 4 (subunit M)
MRELVTFVPLIILAFWIGVYPTFFTKYLDEPVNAIVMRVRADYFKSQAVRIPQLPVQSPLAVEK